MCPGFWLITLTQETALVSPTYFTVLEPLPIVRSSAVPPNTGQAGSTLSTLGRCPANWTFWA
jgi:hypothetical protein